MRSSPRSPAPHPTAWLAVLLLALPAAAVAGGVTYVDIAGDPGSGIAYSRAPSASEATLAAIRVNPPYTEEDILATPIKSRGAPGVALLDYDGDGDLDIYVTNGPGADNGLFANRLLESGRLRFEDTAAEAGLTVTDADSTGACYGDIDNDGDHDLAVLSNEGSDFLFEHVGEGRYVDFGAASGIALDVRNSISCAFGDLDNDGLLDLVITTVPTMATGVPWNLEPYAFNTHNMLFRNLGANRFAEVGAAAGIQALHLPPNAPPGASTVIWAVVLVEIDQDGDVDLPHADDQGAVPMNATGGIDRALLQLFMNDGSGFFTNESFARRVASNNTWMGLAFGDFDHSGTLDSFATSFGNHGIATFVGVPVVLPFNFDSRWFPAESGRDLLRPDRRHVRELGVRGVPINTAFGWGTSATDYDNDGDTDVIFHGGLDAGPFRAHNPGSVLENDGAGNFSRDFLALAGSTDHLRRTVHGMAVGDLDNDGFMDIVSASNVDFPPGSPLYKPVSLGGEWDADAFIPGSFEPVDLLNRIWAWRGVVNPNGTLSVEINRGENGNGAIRVELLGTRGITRGGTVNRDGIGAVVRVKPRRHAPVTLPVLGGSSYSSQDSLIQHAGMGRARYAAVEVLWPGGVRNRLYRVRAGSRIRFPEIPCSVDDPDTRVRPYVRCVIRSLRDLRTERFIGPVEHARFLASALRGFFRERRRP